ncbi:membrane protein [Hyphomonas johnsonii]|uniref:Membrane-anchored protein n=1 Tax=Hyphomonas johnsonii MHS-2 TaxID=1280950 RepID=A0A059FTS5_9PROT|nr:membrane protein [Hyphomonas johnsonii]KCZ94044.1 hypothetical protein HJO_01675 [Hyphomonas johnsonii MHS-2]
MTLSSHAAKVPAVTLGFWIIKIFATTLGETGGDTVSMSLNLGYHVSTGIFLAILIALVALQIAADRFRPALYWATIIASTTAGTTMADFATRSIGIGYAGGSVLLLAGVLAVLWLWNRSEGSISVESVKTPRVEMFYWATITVSQTLGTALGDWIADETPLGYLGGAGLFGAMLAVVALLYYRTAISHALLFWAAFILTRPLGATVGDFLDKPLDHGGLALSRPIASLVLLAIIVGCVMIFPQRPASEDVKSTGSG